MTEIEEVRIWTRMYRPFMMGGNVNAPISTDVTPAGLFDIGKGYNAFLIVSPSGKTHVAEAITGALVGNTIEEVRKDIESAELDVIIQQIEQAKIDAKKATPLTPEDFWRLMRDNK